MRESCCTSRLQADFDPHSASENTTGELIGPMTFGLLSDVNYAMQQCDVNYVGMVKACVTVQGENWLVSHRSASALTIFAALFVLNPRQ